MVNYSKNSPVDGKIEQIIEYFVKFFGEEYRERITERINNTTFIFAGNIDGKTYYDDKLTDLYDSGLIYEREFQMYMQQFMNLDSKKAGAFTFPGNTYSDYIKKGTTKNICVCPPYPALFTSFLVHELTHIVTSDYKLTYGKFHIKSGLDVSEEDFSTKRQTIITNCYILNEIINDYLSIKVLKFMIQDGFCLGKEQFEASRYSRLFPILEGFIENNIKDIISSVMSTDPTKFIEKINVDKFNLIAMTTDKIYHLLNKATYERVTQELDEINIFETVKSSKFSPETNEYINLISQIKPILKEHENESSNNDETEI